MNNEQKQVTYTVYYRPQKEWITVTKQQHDDWERFTNAIRMKQQRAGNCCIPRSKLYKCDGLCNGMYGADRCESSAACEYRCASADSPGFVSIDYAMDTASKEGVSRKGCLNDPNMVTKFDIDSTTLKILLAELRESEPESYQILMLVADGISERESAEQLHMPRNTFVYQRNQLLMRIRKNYF